MYTHRWKKRTNVLIDSDANCLYWKVSIITHQVTLMHWLDPLCRPLFGSQGETDRVGLVQVTYSLLLLYRLPFKLITLGVSAAEHEHRCR